MPQTLTLTPTPNLFLTLESQFYISLSWLDPDAPAAVKESTAAMIASKEGKCDKPCSGQRMYTTPTSVKWCAVGGEKQGWGEKGFMHVRGMDALAWVGRLGPRRAHNAAPPPALPTTAHAPPRPLSCSTVWLPSLLFRNALEFPQGRTQPYTILVTDNGRVNWRSEVSKIGSFEEGGYTWERVQAWSTRVCTGAVA